MFHHRGTEERRRKEGSPRRHEGREGNYVRALRAQKSFFVPSCLRGSTLRSSVPLWSIQRARRRNVTSASSYFAATYVEARGKFRDAAERAGARLSRYT